MPDRHNLILSKARETLGSQAENLHISLESNAYFILANAETNDLKKISIPCRAGQLRDAANTLLEKDREQKTYILGNNVYVSETATLNTDKTEEKFTQREVQILEALLAKKEGCSRENLLRDVWEHTTELETHTLETHIYRLRQKLEKDPNDPQVLITIEGGYKLIFKEN